jgi:PPOX class probable F420-dependent enzyme
MVAEPGATRPHMPGYGLPDRGDSAGLLPWSWARERLESSRRYWVATVRPDGAPHLMAVWGVWLDGALYFSTGPATRKARNLRADPRCTISIEDAGEAVVVEGVAEPADTPEVIAMVRPAYLRKYGSGWPEDGSGPLLAVRPRVAFGFIEREADFSRTATRWTFPG